MRRFRPLVIVAALAASASPADDAAAQGFFERLFGIPSRPAPPPPPPGSIPMQRPQVPGGPPGAPDVPGEASAPSGPVAPREPVVARPVAAKPVADDSVLNRDLKLNGRSGSMRIERAGAALRARIGLEGTMISKPAESCQVQIEGGQPVTLAAQGKPEGLSRYAVEGATCPISFDIVEGAVLVRGPETSCTFEAADCRADPRGLWGPEPATLLPLAAQLEQDRGLSDKAVRDNYKVMTQRAAGQGVRPIVAEQAAFSSEREQVCRDYAREGTHGFCHARYTEARLAALAAKLGLTAVANAPPRGRRPRDPVADASGPGQDAAPFGVNPGTIR
jgi:hypothetical protein